MRARDDLGRGRLFGAEHEIRALVAALAPALYWFGLAVFGGWVCKGEANWLCWFLGASFDFLLAPAVKLWPFLIDHIKGNSDVAFCIAIVVTYAFWAYLLYVAIGLIEPKLRTIANYFQRETAEGKRGLDQR